MKRAGIEILGYIYNGRLGGSESSKMQNYQIGYRFLQKENTPIFHEIQRVSLDSLEEDLKKLPPQAAYHIWMYVMTSFKTMQKYFKDRLHFL
jgi:hypothetical protein